MRLEAKYIRFAIWVEGIRFTGDWSLVNGELEIRSAYGFLPPRALGRRKPELLAEDLLREILCERVAEGCLTPRV